MTTSNHLKISLVGFGEAAIAFASGWQRPDGMAVSAYDIKMSNPAEAGRLIEAAKAQDVEAAQVPEKALLGAKMIFSLVTADQALAAAEQTARWIEKDALFFDCNSCSPSTKVASSRLIEAAGGRYVDIAVMAPVYPAKHLTPLLAAGPHAEAATEALGGLGMRVTAAGDRIGQASSIKMLRSVIIKGFEALTAESMLAARKAGVEDAVLASLQASDPGIDWARRSAYNLERMMVHGARRAAEMREVAKTLSDLGLPDRLSSAAADWQQQIADLQLAAGDGALSDRADRILEKLQE